MLDMGSNIALKVGQAVQNDRQLHSLKHFYTEASSGRMGKGGSPLMQLQEWSQLLIQPTSIREVLEGGGISQQGIPPRFNMES